MTRDKFIDRHCHFPDYNREKFASDLDSLLKERAEKAWDASRRNMRSSSKKFSQYKKTVTFYDWYDTFIKEQL